LLLVGSTETLQLVRCPELLVPRKVEPVQHITLLQHPQLDCHEIEVIQASISRHERVGNDCDGEADLFGFRKQKGEGRSWIYLPGSVGAGVLA